MVAEVVVTLLTTNFDFLQIILELRVSRGWGFIPCSLLLFSPNKLLKVESYFEDHLHLILLFFQSHAIILIQVFHHLELIFTRNKIVYTLYLSPDMQLFLPAPFIKVFYPFLLNRNIILILASHIFRLSI